MPHKLLLADDSVTIQRVIELTFADEDVQVIAVGDGAEAIRRIQADPPDIVLADIGMPEKDGYEVAAFVKGTPQFAHIPVLLLTGAFEPVDEQRAHEVGCDGVLAKPFEPQMVITRVNELLAAGPSRSAGPAAAPGAPATAASAPAQGRPAAKPGVPPTDERWGTSSSALDAFLSAPPPANPNSFEFAPSALDVPARPKPGGNLRAEGSGGARTFDLGDMPGALEDEAARRYAATAHAPVPAAGQADPNSVKISRRTPIAVPGFGAPALPTSSSTSAELDDYFEKLDAAFATLQPAQPREAGGAPANQPFGGSLRNDAPEPLTAIRRGSAPPERGVAPPPDRGPSAPPDRGPSAPAEPAPGMAQAFSALLAAEHGGQTPAAAPAPVNALGPANVELIVERATQQVLQRLSDRVVRETVTDIVSRVAERLVREEIERVKATLK